MKHWAHRGALAWALLPLTALFALLAALRRLAYRRGWWHSERLPAPVIIIGNIVAGGSGKTPVTLTLAQELVKRGRQPGIVSRGYGGKAHGVREVLADTKPEEVGDEPLLLREIGCPVFVGRDRVAAAQALLRRYPACDVILSDDGLQHHRLQRDVEIAVHESTAAGNRWLLPAGPLREPLRRLHTVDAVVSTEGFAGAHSFQLRLTGDTFVNLVDDKQTRQAADFAGLKVFAFAGIGLPQKFFAYLRGLGLDFTPYPFADHHPYRVEDFAFGSGADALLTTRKDAVKLRALSGFAYASKVWSLPVTAHISPDLAAFVLAIITENAHGCPPA